MNRRSFLSGWTLLHQREPHRSLPDSLQRPAAAGLEPWQPSDTAPWDAVRAGHLLRRMHFLPRWSDIETLLGMTPSEAVDLLLDTPYEPDPPSVADHLTESLEGLDQENQSRVRGIWRGDAGKLRSWYVQVMRDCGLSGVEKMAAFWSGHFAVEFQVEQDYVVAPLLYRMNRMFRKDGLAKFDDLTMGVTLDGAMLVYLGGALNTVGAPNENYGRELMELYTTGLGQYTEGDVKEAARILTGWVVPQYDGDLAPNGMFVPYFVASRHDANSKQFLGTSFPARDSSTNTEFLVRRDEVRKLIDTIFEKRAEATARFISRKIYRYFVYSNPAQSDEAVIDAMAALLIQSGFEIKPVMAALLKSAHFFDNLNLGAQIKTPAELVIGMVRQLGVDDINMSGPMAEMEMILFNPPNVSGWPGYRDWITTTTFPIRSDFASNVIDGMTEEELLNFIEQFPEHDQVESLVPSLAALLLPRPLSDGRRDAFISRLTGGAPPYEWTKIMTEDRPTAARNMQSLLRTVVNLPDFQLC